MATQIFKLNIQDLLKSAYSAVFAAAVIAIAGVVSQPGFDVFAVDWSALLKLVINVSLSTLIGDIARRFATDSDGKLFGRI